MIHFLALCEYGILKWRFLPFLSFCTMQLQSARTVATTTASCKHGISAVHTSPNWTQPNWLRSIQPGDVNAAWDECTLRSTRTGADGRHYGLPASRLYNGAEGNCLQPFISFSGQKWRRFSSRQSHHVLGPTGLRCSRPAAIRFVHGKSGTHCCTYTTRRLRLLTTRGGRILQPSRLSEI